MYEICVPQSKKDYNSKKNIDKMYCCVSSILIRGENMSSTNVITSDKNNRIIILLFFDYQNNRMI
jgi:hypothetical protein